MTRHIRPVANSNSFTWDPPRSPIRLRGVVFGESFESVEGRFGSHTLDRPDSDTTSRARSAQTPTPDEARHAAVEV